MKKNDREQIAHPNGGLIFKMFMRCAPAAWKDFALLAKCGLLDDVFQEMQLTAVELAHQSAEVNYREFVNAVQRHSYDFWCAYGFRKARDGGQGVTWRAPENFNLEDPEETEAEQA